MSTNDTDSLLKIWGTVSPFFKTLVIIIIIIFILGVIKDRYYYSHGKYTPDKLHLRIRRSKKPGSSSDKYARYWFWERKKRATLLAHYRSQGLLPYTGHATSNGTDRSHIPFRCEVYCKSKN